MSFFLIASGTYVQSLHGFQVRLRQVGLHFASESNKKLLDKHYSATIVCFEYPKSYSGSLHLTLEHGNFKQKCYKVM